MKNRARSIVRAAWVVALLAPATVAAGQETSAAQGFSVNALMGGVISTVVYGLVGILLTMIGFKLFSMVLPFDVKKELEEDQNVAVGVLLAALVLGVCLVVAATIHS